MPAPSTPDFKRIMVEIENIHAEYKALFSELEKRQLKLKKRVAALSDAEEIAKVTKRIKSHRRP